MCCESLSVHRLFGLGVIGSRAGSAPLATARRRAHSHAHVCVWTGSPNMHTSTTRCTSSKSFVQANSITQWCGGDSARHCSPSPSHSPCSVCVRVCVCVCAPCAYPYACVWVVQVCGQTKAGALTLSPLVPHFHCTRCPQAASRGCTPRRRNAVYLQCHL